MTTFRYITKGTKRVDTRGQVNHETAIHRALDNTAPVVSVNIITAVRQFAGDLTVSQIEALLKTAALDAVDLGLPFNLLEKLLAENIKPDMVRAVKQGAQAAQSETAGTMRAALGVKPILTFDGSNYRVQRYINKKTAAMVTNVTDETKKSIRQAVKRALTEEINTIETHRAIKRVIGLNVRQEQALSNYKKALQEAKATNINAKVDAYAEKQLKYRADMIARTETLDAMNQGELEGIRQARDAGYITNDEQPMKVWDTAPEDGRVCPTCRAMDGVSVGLDEPFTVELISAGKSGASLGNIVIDKPPAHPHCRCTFHLEFADGSQQAGDVSGDEE